MTTFKSPNSNKLLFFYVNKKIKYLEKVKSFFVTSSTIYKKKIMPSYQTFHDYYWNGMYGGNKKRWNNGNKTEQYKRVVGKRVGIVQKKERGVPLL